MQDKDLPGRGLGLVSICSQLPDNDSTSVTTMGEYLVAEVVRKHALSIPLIWVEHYPEYEGNRGVRFGAVLHLGDRGDVSKGAWCIKVNTV